tara:strand:- start:6695 stop:7126 length:432 start_codon:yes stop_codon:yes gene_type:complete
MNQIQLVGRLGDNPELRTTQSGTTYAYLRIVTNEYYQDSSGTWQESSEWHTLKIWNRSYERAAQTLKRGNLVSVVGQLRSFEKTDGTGRLWEVKVEKWRNLTKRDETSTERRNDPFLPPEPVATFASNTQHNPTPWGEGFTRR